MGAVLPLGLAYAVGGALETLLTSQSMAPEDQWRVSAVLWMVLRVWAEGAALVALLGAAQGRPVSLGAAARAGVRLWGRMLGTSFVVGLQVALLCLLLVVPGLMRYASIGLAQAAAAHRETGGAVFAAEERSRGYRWPLGTVLVGGWLLSTVVQVATNLAVGKMQLPGASGLVMLPLTAGLGGLADSLLLALWAAAYLMLDARYTATSTASVSGAEQQPPAAVAA